MDTCLDVAVGQLLGVQCIVDILATRRIDGADDFLAHVDTVAPCTMGHVLGRDNPAVTLGRQTVENSFAERSIGHIMFEKERLLLCFLGFGLSERADEVAIWVARSRSPSIECDEDLLTHEILSLACANTDTRKLAVDRCGEDGLCAETRKRGRVDRLAST